MCGVNLGSLPDFVLPDLSGSFFRSMDMRGLRWVLAIVKDANMDVLRLLESRHARLMMMNTPLVTVVVKDPVDIKSLCKDSGLRLNILTDPQRVLAGSIDNCLMIIDKNGTIDSSYNTLDITSLDRLIQRLRYLS